MEYYKPPVIECRIETIPEVIRKYVESAGIELTDVTNIFIDRGDSVRVHTRDTTHSGCVVDADEYEALVDSFEFDAEGRAALPGGHRVAALYHRDAIAGITVRIARSVIGVAAKYRSVIRDSTIVIGPPSSGKTTLLRGIIMELQSFAGERVVVIDTSEEFANIPCRRIVPTSPLEQSQCMLAALENHSCTALVVDEISTAEEAAMAVSVARRGVKLYTTVHGTGLLDVLYNDELKTLMGDVHTVTLSYREKNDMRDTKVRNEVKTSPAFNSAIILPDGVLVKHLRARCSEALHSKK